MAASCPYAHAMAEAQFRLDDLRACKHEMAPGASKDHAAAHVSCVQTFADVHSFCKAIRFKDLM